MKQFLFSLVTLTGFAIAIAAAPTPPPAPQKASTVTSNELVRSANGWTFVKGEWIHPEGYKYENGKVLRTTARRGRAVPQPPGKLALENPQKLAPTTTAVTHNAAKTETDKAAERARNLAPRPAPQTGSNL